MPYIKKQDRDDINRVLWSIVQEIEKQDIHYFSREGQFDKTTLNAQRELNPGVLNYAISKLIHKLLERKGVSYSRVNLIIGVLESLKLELYRQVIAPYEDKKKFENGSVSNLDAPKLEDVR